MIRFTAMAITALISFGAHADYYGGEDLAKWSDALMRAKANTAVQTDYADVGKLRGLAIGVHDVFEGTSVCSPDNATNGQIVDTVVVYVRNHPEKRTENASRLAYEALSTAYPCKK
ncbi:Rap1a/Tai family immunity protein [Cronobacter dublinensis]